MKRILIGLTIVLSFLASGVAFSQPSAVNADTPYAVVERGPNHRVWQQTTYDIGPDGIPTPTIHSYVELATGMHYLDGNSNWVESSAHIDILPNNGGAVSTNGEHKVFYPPDIFTQPVEVNTPDGQWMRSEILGLSFYDTASGQSVMIAELTNSVGVVQGDNVVIYPNAFTDFAADVRLTYTVAGFEQDIIIEQQMPSPAEYGLNPETTHLEVLTEFFQPPQPAITVFSDQDSTNAPAPAAVDEFLDFGAMKMGSGKAFSIGNQDDPLLATAVSKEWAVIDGRTILFESVPWSAVASQIANLPPPTQQASTGKATHHLVSSKRLLPNARVAKAGGKPMKMVRSSKPSAPGFVMDYTLMNSATNFTFRGDTTYYISGLVNLSGTNTFEGGTVIKFANTNSAEIYIAGGVNCLTGPGRPAVLTAKDDNSIGETISGSTGTPSGSYATTAIGGTASLLGSPVWQYLRIDYANNGLAVPGNINHVQFLNVNTAITAGGGPVYLANALMCNVSNQCFNLTSNLTVVNLTVHDANALGTVTNGSVGITNSLFICVTNCALSGGPTVIGVSCNATNATDSGVFQTVGAGNHYLAAGSSYRNSGTTNIDQGILAALRTKTTYPPLLYSNVTITTNLVLLPQATRDTSSTPDLGWHYDPIDWIADRMVITNATLLVTNGTVIASYDDNGICLTNGSAIVSVGLANNLNEFERYTLIQEQPVTIGALPVTSGWNINPNHTGSAAPSGYFRFTQFATPAENGPIFYDTGTYVYNNLLVQDCFLWNGTNNFAGASNTEAVLKNSLFYRSTISASGASMSSLTLTNNLILGTTNLVITQPSNVIWYALNNDFDSCTIATNSLLTNLYNAFVTCTGKLFPTNVSNLTVNNSLGYETSWLGNFYQPTNSPLLQKGSTNANYLGLFQYTTQTNQVKQSNSIVDIGLHYVATDAYGNPLNASGDGSADYIEDANGDGLVDNGETSWLNGQPTVSITTPTNNASFLAPTNLTISATVSANGPAVSQAQFFAGQFLIGTSTTSPYSVTWANPPAGTYALTAVGTLTDGVKGTSAVVNIIISTNLTILGDAHVRDGTNANKNFGTNILMEAMTTSSTNNNRDVYFLFNTGSISNISSATLNIFAWLTNSGNITNILYSVANTSWGETTIDWNNKPSRVTPLATNAINSTAGAWYQYNVSSYVISNSTIGQQWVSFALHCPVSNATPLIDIDSLQSSTNKPYLSFNTTNSAPNVSITSPPNNAMYASPASITINASASAYASISQVQFFEGSTSLGIVTSPPYTVTWTNVSDGDYTLTAVATDDLSDSTTSSGVTVHVRTAPSITITAPANDTILTAPASTNIQASVTAGSATVTNVQFYRGVILLGQTNNSPWQCSWTNIAAGIYTLTAEAEDTNGLWATSAPVDVTVVGACDHTFSEPEFTSGFTFDLTNVGNGLQLSSTNGLMPFIYIASSTNGTVLRMSSANGQILGEYRTCPKASQNPYPSHEAIDQYGNVWVANWGDSSGDDDSTGQGTITRIGVVIGGTRGDLVSGVFTPDPNGQYLKPPFTYSTAIDKNGDGYIETSSGLGNILNWTNSTPGNVSNAVDECIINYGHVPDPDASSLAIDVNNNLWAGGYQSNAVHVMFNGNTGQILTNTEISFKSGSLHCGGFESLIDQNGVLWSEGGNSIISPAGNNTMVRYNPTNTAAIVTNTPFSMAIDPTSGEIWVANYYSNTVAKYTTNGTLIANYYDGDVDSCGLLVDKQGNVWVSHSFNASTPTVGHLLTNGTFLGNITLLNTNVNNNQGSVAVDMDDQGYVWALCRTSREIQQIDPNAGIIITNNGVGYALGAVINDFGLGNTVYADEDGRLTGYQRQNTTPAGFWDYVLDSTVTNQQWSTFTWNASTINTNQVRVEVRASNLSTLLTQQYFQQVADSVTQTNLSGRYLEVRVTFTQPAGTTAPTLYNLTVSCGQTIQPTITTLQPTTGGQYLGPTNLNLTAYAYNPDANISQVAFYDGSTLLGTATTGTNYDYSFVWTNATTGSLTAVVTDDHGNMATSSVVNVTIDSEVFDLGIDMTGPAVTILNNSWLGYTNALASGLSVSNAFTNSAGYSFTLTPPSAPATNTMLQSWIEQDRLPSIIYQTTNSPIFWGHFPPPTYMTNDIACVTLSNIPPGYPIVTNGSNYACWCLDLAIDPSNNVAYPCKLYYTYDNPVPRFSNVNWSMINYVLNHKEGCQDDIQNAIWSLLGEGIYYSVDSAFINMTNNAILYGTNFVPQPGQIAMIVADAGVGIHRWGFEVTNLPVSFNLTQTLANGYYYIYPWMVENVTNYQHSLNFALQGTNVATNLDYVPLGRWNRYGPYGVNVTNGSLAMSVSTPAQGNPELMGLEIDDVNNSTSAIAVYITSPANGHVFVISPTNTLLSATAVGVSTIVSNVQFFANSTDLGPARFVTNSTNYSLNWQPVLGGAYQLTATAVATNGLMVTSAPVSITVNLQPTVSITSPTNSQQFFSPSTNITIDATAADSDGTVASVQFFEGTNSLGVDTTSPYSVLWTNVQPGTYMLVARATDNEGATSNSAAVVITVYQTNSPPAVNPGPNQTVLIQNPAVILGTASDDGLPVGSSLTVSWSQVSGPGTTTFTMPSQASTEATFSALGVYVLQLSANDSQFTTFSNVTITVISNSPPFVYPGPNLTVTNTGGIANTMTIGLQGVVTDDGLPTNGTLVSTWSQVSGPGPVTFLNANLTNTMAVFTGTGSFVLQLSATDGQLITTSNVSMTVTSIFPFPYGASGYTYASIYPNQFTGPITNFFETNFDDSAWTNGTAGFGDYGYYRYGPYAGQAITCTTCTTENSNDIGTYWGDNVDDDILVRKWFYVPPETTNMDMGFTVDNNAQVFVDGTLITNGIVALDGAYFDPSTGWYYHMECANYEDMTITNIATNIWHTGMNLLAVHGEDGGCIAFLDMRIRLNSPEATYTNHPPVIYINPNYIQVTSNSFIINAVIMDDGYPAGGDLAATWSQSDWTNESYYTCAPNGVDFGPNVTYTNFSSTFTFNPTGANAPTNYMLRIIAQDGQPLYTTNYCLVTVHFETNAAPTVTLVQPTNNSVYSMGVSIPLNATAMASTGSVASVSFLASGPAGITSLGEVTSSPFTIDSAALVPGTYTVTAQATDQGGRTGSSSPITIEVTSNLPPVAAEDEVTVLANSTYNLLSPLTNDVDPGSYPMTIVSVTAPQEPGSVVQIINGGQNLNFIPAPNFYTGAGYDYFYYSITDGHGGISTAPVIVYIQGEAMPTVEITSPAQNSTYTAGDPVTLETSVQPSTFQGTVEFLLNNNPLGSVSSPPYNLSWNAVYDSSQAGIIAVATDIYGQVNYSAPLYLNINVPTDGTDAGPMARLDNLVPTNSTVSTPAFTSMPIVRNGLFVLRGAAYATNASNPTVSYDIRVLNSSNVVLQDSGFIASTVGSASTTGTLLTNDFTTLQNGVYTLELLVRAGYEETSTNVQFGLDSNVKIGQFSFSEQDAAIPAGGYPLTVTRTYNSQNQNVGSFGSGWTYALSDINMSIDEERRDTKYLDIADVAPYTPSGTTFSMRVGGGRDVTLTLPDGRTTTFYYSLVQSQCDSGQAVDLCATPAWQSVQGVNYSLGLINPVKLTYLLTSDLEWWSDDASTAPDNYDFSGFYLTNNTDGTIYRIDRDDYGSFDFTDSDGGGYAHAYGPGYLSQVIEPSGNKILIQPNGLTEVDPLGNTNRTIAFQRDDQGRIIAMYNPTSLDSSGNPTGPASVTYSYAGQNLASVSRLQDGSNPSSPVYLTTTYEYTNSTFPHFITGIEDPAGVTVARNTYDSSGKLLSVMDANGNLTQFSHNVSGQVETVIDRLEHTNITAYDNLGNITATTNALNQIKLMAYNSNNNKTNEIDYLNGLPYATNSYQYDGNGNLLSSTDPLGDTTTSTYDADGRVLTTVDARGFGVTNTYDGNENLTKAVDALGNTTLNTYNSSSLLTATVNAIGTVTANTYDGSADLLSTATSDSSGNILTTNTFAYDANGNQTNSTIWRRVNGTWTGATTMTVFDSMNRVIETIFPDGGSNSVVYNSIGKQQSTTDQLSHTTTYAYDTSGRLTGTTYADGTTATSGYDANGNRTSSVDQLDRTTSYSYDAINELTNTTYPDFTLTQTIYDDMGRTKFSVDAKGTQTAYAYDAAGRQVAVTNAFGTGVQMVSSSTFDANGNQVTSTDPAGHTTTYVYDPLNRQVDVEYADGTTSLTGYDPAGRKFASTNQDNIVTLFGYDGAGRLVSVTNALNKAEQTITRYSYDEAGNETAQIDALLRTNQYFFDGLGRRIQHTMPGLQSEGYAYDLAGNLLYHTSFNGIILTNQYDTMNRLVTKSSGGGYKITFAYSPTGQRTNMADLNGITSYLYDLRDRLISKVVPLGYLNVPLNYGYDSNGNVTNILSGYGGYFANLYYLYDPLNRLTGVYTFGSLAASYGYDANGNLQSTRYGNGVTNLYQYTILNQLTNVLWMSNALVEANFNYRLGRTGNRTNLAENLNGASQTYSWSYDSLYRMTNENIGSLGNLGYAFDPVGNRTNRNSTVSGLASQTPSVNTNDWLTTDTYDSDGNTTLSASKPYQYDAENHLTNFNNGTVTIVYDGDGNRIAKTVGGSETYYLVDDRNPSGYAQVLGESPGGSFGNTYTYGLNLISQQNNGSSLVYFGTDGHGSTRFLMDTGGTVLNTFTYDAYGTLIASNGAPQTAYLYCGQQYDSDLGLYYNRARYLNVGTGRFWSRDTDEGSPDEPLSLHKYLYCEDGPVDRSDPTGLKSYVGFNVEGFGGYGHVGLITHCPTNGIYTRFDHAWGHVTEATNSVASKMFLGYDILFVIPDQYDSALDTARRAFVPQNGGALMNKSSIYTLLYSIDNNCLTSVVSIFNAAGVPYPHDYGFTPDSWLIAFWNANYGYTLVNKNAIPLIKSLYVTPPPAGFYINYGSADLTTDW